MTGKAGKAVIRRPETEKVRKAAVRRPEPEITAEKALKKKTEKPKKEKKPRPEPTGEGWRRLASFKEGAKDRVGDIPLLVTMLVLIALGMLMLYSASWYGAERDTGDAFFYVKKQLLSFVPGLVLMFACTKINTELVRKYSWVVLILSYVLLALVFIPGLGIENYGARRWLNLGFTTIQPSEFAKFGLVIFIAAQMTKRSTDKVRGMLPVVAATGLMCLLIMLQPNMSITLCILAVMLIMMFLGGTKLKHFGIMGAVLAVAAVLLVLIEPYRMKRLVAFVDPWATPLGEGYQLIQSYYALGSGGLFGLGLFNSRQKYLFLPFAESDFIFSIIGEELGWVGSFFFIALYLIIIFRGVRIAMRATNRFDCFMAAGITAVIAVQTVMNIAVVTGSVPPTGLPLPFISAGGSSLMFFMCATGLLMNVAKRTGHNRKTVLSQR